jgi:hypothetical protein
MSKTGQRFRSLTAELQWLMVGALKHTVTPPHPGGRGDDTVIGGKRPQPNISGLLLDVRTEVGESSALALAG